MRTLYWTTPAKTDLAQLFDPFSIERPEFIDSALAQIARLENLLVDNPGIGAPLENSVLRKLRVGRTPLILIYRTEGSVIEVLRVRHSASDRQRNP